MKDSLSMTGQKGMETPIDGLSKVDSSKLVGFNPWNPSTRQLDKMGCNY